MSGEKAGDRQVIESNTRDLINAGVKRDKAEQMARESMRRVDQKLRDQGKR